MATDPRARHSLTVPAITRIEEFGRIDAESELQLADFFVRTDAYMRIEDLEHVVVIGRKGTGKTAIYKALLQRSARFSNTHAVGLQFRNYPWGAHAEVENAAAAPVERYTESWKFLILIELAKLALLSPRLIPKTKEGQGAAQGVARFIRNNWGQVQFEFKDIFSKKKYSFEIEPRFAGAAIGSVRIDEVPRPQLGGFLVEVNRWLRDSLNHMLASENYYYVLFDDLDRGYEPGNPDYAHRLIGLLLAAREIFNWGDELGLAVGPIVFLRSDIYEELRFPDKNKLTENTVEILTWTDEAEGENSLKKLIDQRIRVLVGRPSRDPWSLVFDDQVMRGTQPKYKHMAARTYLRPRDMIQFANYCLRQAKAARADRIQNRHIVAARPDYSNYLIRELEDEMADAVPSWMELLDVLRRIHKMRFSRDEFERAYEMTRAEERCGLAAEKALEALYRFSVIGFTKAGGSGYGGSAVAFKYRDPKITFDLGARTLQVHPGLKETLDLVEAGDR